MRLNNFRQTTQFSRIKTVMEIAVTIQELKNAPCPAKWIIPQGVKAKGTLLYVHGGSFTLGASPLVTNMVCEIARQCGCKILMPDYRLAPEHPCPAAIEDIQALYTWVLSQSIDPKSIIFTGEQAGACIALASLQQCQKNKLPMPAGMVLYSPLVDLTLSNWAILLRGISGTSHSRELLMIAIRLYLGINGKPMDSANALASPLFGDMKGLPPLLIQARNDSFIMGDANRLVCAFEAEGGNVTLGVWPETKRLWERYAPEHYGAMVAASVQFIGKRLHAADGIE